MRLQALGVDDALRRLGSAKEPVTELEIIFDPEKDKDVDQAAERLAGSLHGDAALQRLLLRGNCIGPRGAAKLAQLLTSCRALWDLDLKANAVGSEGAQHLATALQRGAALTSLDLNFNGIRDDGASFIAAALEANRTLQRLELGSNDIRDAGVIRLAEAIENNAGSLLELGLSGNNHWGTQGAARLEAALAKNPQLSVLRVNIDKIVDSSRFRTITELHNAFLAAKESAADA